MRYRTTMLTKAKVFQHEVTYKPSSFSHETNDCTVRALAAALTIPYKDAHDTLKQLGREDGKGVRGFSYVVEKALKLAGINYFKIPLKEKGIKTPKSLIAQYPTSTILCIHRNHAFTIKQGIMSDFTGDKVRLYDAWIIIKSNVTVKCG